MRAQRSSISALRLGSVHVAAKTMLKLGMTGNRFQEFFISSLSPPRQKPKLSATIAQNSIKVPEKCLQTEHRW
ncbi:MAG TPA: hypothetical protein VLT37_08925 [Acidocella sp.]|nr:hypothetical protein [Acidocella sp.]